MATAHILVLTHGDAGKALLGSSEMIVGPSEKLAALSLQPGMSVETFTNQVRQELDTNAGPTLVLVDVFGGTPSNVAMALSRAYDIRCVSGLNLGMLIETLVMRESQDTLELAELQRIALTAGTTSCRAFTYDELCEVR